MVKKSHFLSVFLPYDQLRHLLVIRVINKACLLPHTCMYVHAKCWQKYKRGFIAARVQDGAHNCSFWQINVTRGYRKRMHCHMHKLAGKILLHLYSVERISTNRDSYPCLSLYGPANELKTFVFKISGEVKRKKKQRQKLGKLNSF